MEQLIKSIFGENHLSQISHISILIIIIWMVLNSCGTKHELSDNWSIIYSDVDSKYSLTYNEEGIINGFSNYTVIEDNKEYLSLKVKKNRGEICIYISKHFVKKNYGTVPNSELYQIIKCN